MPHRLFTLQRDQDLTGISGIGIVAEGCVFSNGRAVLMWQARGLESLVLHDSLENIEKIHGHDGRTRVVFMDNLDRQNPTILSGLVLET